MLVNRIWQQHFGNGFVNTPDDLGNMCSAPVNPELLDWLAAGFVESGWSIKQLQRTIVLSSTYQQSGAPNEAAAAVDPENRLLWRANLHRLDFEELYDSLLRIAGTLDPTVSAASPSRRPEATRSAPAARSTPTSTGATRPSCSRNLISPIPTRRTVGATTRPSRSKRSS